MSVLVSVPNLGWIHKSVCFVTDRLLLDVPGLRLIRPTHRPYENNLHHIVLDLLEGGEDWWLNIDADNPPLRNPLELIQHDKDIMGLPTPVWHWTGKKGERPVYWNVYRHAPDDDAYIEWMPREGLQQVDAVGTGCFLAKAEVFRVMLPGMFQRTYNTDGTVDKGNDIAFCERAHKVGFEVWAHFDYPCDHWVENSLNEVVRAFKGLADG